MWLTRPLLARIEVGGVRPLAGLEDAGLAPGLGHGPLLLAVPAAIAASWAFMLPAATPPNAAIFGSGLVTIRHMSRAGLWLNGVGVAVVTLATYAVAMPLLAAR